MNIYLLILTAYLLSGCQDVKQAIYSGDTLFVGSNLCKIAPSTHNLEVFILENEK